MENAILISFDFENRGTKLPAVKGNIEIGRKKYSITAKEVLNNDNLESLATLLKRTWSTNHTIIFSTFQPFKKNLDKLELLKESRIPFRFLDFESLTLKTVGAVIELSERNSEERSKKIKAALDLKREKGAVLGNPEIASANGKAIRRRKLNAWKNETNTKARKLISYLKEKEDWSFNQIAEYLNKEGFKTSMNNKFLAKSVQRLYFSYKELNETFIYKQISDSLDNPPIAVNQEQRLMIEGIEEGEVFNKKIKFTIKSPLKKRFEVLIRDKSGKGKVFSKIYTPEEKEVEIDIDEHILLPGTHYINIITDKQEDYQSILHLRISLRDKLKFTPDKLEGIEDLLRLIPNKN